jgi:ubiquinone/menaquinone biosynthesis C-methylase UbiE
MNWHRRYAQQANWTRELRSYIFEQTDLRNTARVLEVGCGTGAILSEIPEGPAIYGLDISYEALIECKLHARRAIEVQGDALTLPFPEGSFDIVYSHFLLLWVKDPLKALQEMKRVAKKGGYVMSFAEPDYLSRVDAPEGLNRLGEWQAESLRGQGADPGLGARLGELFFEAGIKIRETGKIQNADQKPTHEESKIEWEVIESDLQGIVSEEEIQKLKRLDQQAWMRGTRVLHVPTYFAWGQV